MAAKPIRFRFFFVFSPAFLVLFNISDVKMSLDSWDRAKPARMPVLYIPYYIQSGMTFFAFWFGSTGSPRALKLGDFTEGLAASSFGLIRFSKHSGKRGCVTLTHYATIFSILQLHTVERQLYSRNILFQQIERPISIYSSCSIPGRWFMATSSLDLIGVGTQQVLGV